MANYKFAHPAFGDIPLIGTGKGPNIPVFYICDVDASKPSSGLKKGDSAYCIDTQVRYECNDGTTWVAAGGVPDATASVKGILQLAGDLGGTAASPVVNVQKVIATGVTLTLLTDTCRYIVNRLSIQGTGRLVLQGTSSLEVG